MLLLIFLMCYPFFVVGYCLALNAKGLLPGTANYRIVQSLRQSEIQTQLARTHAISARYRAAEDEQINKVLAIEVQSRA